MCDEERSRYADFCQFRRTIRGSREHLIVGIDIAKEKHYAFLGTATGKTLLKRVIFENTRQGFAKLLTHTEAMRTQHGLSHVVFGMEPTGDYHKPLGNFLIQEGYPVVLVSGVAAKRNRELLDGRWDKHDTKDAANIADLISQGKCLFYEQPSPRISELRALLGLRKRLKLETHAVMMRIRNNLIARHFPELDRWYTGTEEHLAIVRWCLDPKKIASMAFPEFFQLVTSRTRGLRQETGLRRIYAEAAQSIGCPLDAGNTDEARVLVERLSELRTLIKGVDARIALVSRQFPEYGYLLTIPGFGPYIAALVMASLGNPARFGSARQVLKMAGLDLSASRSGQTSQAAVPVISKKGKAELRYALYQAAVIACAKNGVCMNYLTDKLRGRAREKGIKTKMRVKLAAKLLVIAWTLMQKQQAFNPALLGIPSRASV